MAKSFRTEVFNLCNILLKDPVAIEAGSLIRNLSMVTEAENGKAMSRGRNDLAELAHQNNNEFFSFLLADENIDNMKLPTFLKPSHLNDRERGLFARGHKTMTRFIELCLSDIADISKTVAEAMSPYFLYKEITSCAEAEALLTDEELSPAVMAFKNGSVYKALIASNFPILFGKFDINTMRVLIDTMEKEIQKNLGKNVEKNLEDFYFRLDLGLKSTNDIMFAFLILMIAIRYSLKLACHTMYRAICGINLYVLNENNIINIEGKTSTLVSEFFKVLSQDLPIGYFKSEMGSVLLIDCNLPYGQHLHEFGMVIAESLNLCGEYGQTAKYSFVTVDDEFIPIHQLTKGILRAGLPIKTKK